jgi:hypothetical protein
VKLVSGDQETKGLGDIEIGSGPAVIRLLESRSAAHPFLSDGPGGDLERAKGFEPSTSTLARLRSTPELRPHAVAYNRDELLHKKSRPTWQ